MFQPLLKKPTADHKDFVNFRQVSNLKYVSKLIENAVVVQLNDYLASNNLHFIHIHIQTHTHTEKIKYINVPVSSWR